MRKDINSNSRYWSEVKCFIWTYVELPENINRMSACLNLNIAAAAAAGVQREESGRVVTEWCVGLLTLTSD